MIDPEVCPRCGQDNRCAVTAGKEVSECWCFSQPILPQALAAVPPEALGKACLCPRCARDGAAVEGAGLPEAGVLRAGDR